MMELRTAIGGLAAGLLLLPTLASAQAPQKPGTGVTLATHRAVYDITLERAASGSGVNDVAGRMVYELTGSPCEGYTQNMRFVTRMSSGEGGSQLSDLRSSSFEDSTGRRFRFTSSNYKDDQLSESTQGDATRDDGAVKVDLTRPNRKSVSLSPSVYFPVQHTMALIEAARAGKSIFIADLYDGSEKGEKVYATTTAIGKRIAPGAVKTPAAVKNGDLLDRQPAWPVSISYFEPGSEKKDAVPSYELAFRFYDNGVSNKLVIDYGEFAIRGELKELEMIEAPKCDAGGTLAPAPGKR